MTFLKGVTRSGASLVALAPGAPYMALAGAVDDSFSSSARFEIFGLDFDSGYREFPLAGEARSSERFNRLSWGRPAAGYASEEFSLGLVAGGLVNGTIDIWNPLALIRPESNANAFVGHLIGHRGPVRGLEYNAITPNLLASGADYGGICIWDLENHQEPSYFSPPKVSGFPAAQAKISFLSWNSKVQHMLASTTYNGLTVVWDIKVKKHVASFSDSVRRRCSVLQWNPDIETQFVVASDDDSSPSVRLWDLRKITTPVKEFTGHIKGVIAMAWCPTGSSYLITCAKDCRTICWDTVSGEIVCELAFGTNLNCDVHWYPKIPGVISASSSDGKVGFYHLELSDSPSEMKDSLVNSLLQECLKVLNTANEEDLKKIKGISDKRAKYIMEHRCEKRKPFESLDDLIEVGIPKKEMQRIMKKMIAERIDKL